MRKCSVPPTLVTCHDTKLMTLTSGRDVVDDVAAWITDNIIGHLATLPLGGLKLTMPLALVRRAESRYD